MGERCGCGRKRTFRSSAARKNRFIGRGVGGSHVRGLNNREGIVATPIVQALDRGIPRRQPDEVARLVRSKMVHLEPSELLAVLKAARQRSARVRPVATSFLDAG
jgi:hypothetical protein